MQMDGKPEKTKIPEELFLKIRQKAEEIYKNTGPTYCPYLKDKVNFNSEGFEHIKFKKWNKPRNHFDQYLRLKLFYLVPEILKKSHTVQGVWNTKEWERQKKHGRWESTMKEVSYYEFISVIGKVRIKSIVKQVSGGQKFFWSVIPFWRMNPVTKEKKLFDNDLE